MRFRRALVSSFLLSALVACGGDRPSTPAEPLHPSIFGLDPSLGAAPLDAALEDALDAAAPGDLIEIVVDAGDVSAVGTIGDALAGLGAGVIALEHLPILGAIATPAVISAARLVPGIECIHLNRRLDYLLAEGVASIRADAVHGLGYTGSGVGIAIMDSGIDGLVNPDVAYPDKTVQNVKFAASLRDLLTPGVALLDDAPALFVEDLPNTETSMGHGTHVAAIAGGTGVAFQGRYGGVAPGADLVGVSVGDALFMFWVLAGFDWILENRELHNIQVVNNSWGTTGDFDPSDPINEATRALHDAGIAVVFAAGNSGPDANTLNPYSAAPWVVSVAAGCKTAGDAATWTGPCEDGSGRDPVLASFSSRGLPGNALVHPDVTAPGALIVSGRASTGAIMTVLDAPDDLTTCAIAALHLPYYTCASGTSMAAPHVAGVIALMEEASGGTLTPDEALEILTTTAQPLAGYAEWEVGSGYVDALAAVEAVLAR